MMNAGTLLNVPHEDMTGNNTDVSTSSSSNPGSRAINMVCILSLICLFLITTNAMLLYCIQKNKKSNWAKQTKQIFYLIVSDLVVGLLLIPVVANYALSIQRKGFIYCAFINFSTFCPQVISNYHMLSVCWHRYRMVKRMHLPASSDGYRYDIESCVIWAFVMLAFSAPYFLWGRYDDALEHCRPTDLFGPANRLASFYILVLYCLPATVAILLYVFIFLYLRKNTIRPVSDSVLNRNKTKPNQLPQETQNNVVLTTLSPAIQESARLPTIKRSRIIKIVKVIGCLLLVLNISMIPPVISFSMVTSGTENTVGALLIFTYLNNICNPFIYSVSITPLREEMKNVLKAMFIRQHAIVMRIITPE